MTDEEKARKYAHEKMAWCEDYDFDYATAENYIRQGVLYGLAEGKKEGASEMSRHILEELKKHSIYGTELIRDIIKNLGVEV